MTVVCKYSHAFSNSIVVFPGSLLCHFDFFGSNDWIAKNFVAELGNILVAFPPLA
jgi:hypothetical protein